MSTREPNFTALDHFLDLSQPGLIRDIARVFGCAPRSYDTNMRWSMLRADARKELNEMRSQLEKYRRAEVTK